MSIFFLPYLKKKKINPNDNFFGEIPKFLGSWIIVTQPMDRWRIYNMRNQLTLNSAIIGLADYRCTNQHVGCRTIICRPCNFGISPKKWLVGLTSSFFKNCKKKKSGKRITMNCNSLSHRESVTENPATCRVPMACVGQ